MSIPMAHEPMFSRRVCQVLHDEHVATLQLLERLSAFLKRHGSEIPAADASLTGRLLQDLARALDTEVTRHFTFEEERLFGHLAAAGEAAIGAHLTDDHEAMRPLARELAQLARAAAGSGFEESGWRTFRRVGKELGERLQDHVHKEEMALLPLLEEHLDAASDANYYDAYLGSTEAQP